MERRLNIPTFRLGFFIDTLMRLLYFYISSYQRFNLPAASSVSQNDRRGRDNTCQARSFNLRMNPEKG